MRRKDRETSREFALEIVDKCEYAVLSVIDADGLPYCVPITIVRDGEAVYFHCAKDGAKIDAMRKNPNVCLACVGNTNRLKDKFTTEFESAIVKGKAEEVYDENEKIHALKLLCERHTPTNMANFDAAIERSLSRTAIWKISVVSITGKQKKSK
jgi:hypothetical protein